MTAAEPPIPTTPDAPAPATVQTVVPAGTGILRRERTRAHQVPNKTTRKEIAERVLQFYRDDWDMNEIGRAERLERNAKIRQWTRSNEGPWDDSSDVKLPDMAEASHRTQDTLYNAVISGRPTARAVALKEDDEPQEKTIDNLLDAQLFVEQPGEDILSDAVQCFTDDPALFIFSTWVRERREVVDRRTFEPIPEDRVPAAYFSGILRDVFGNEDSIQLDEEGWDWIANQDGDDRADVSFYTDKDGVEMLVHRTAEVYDGPRCMVKSYDDVLFPPRSANLQIPSPSNPGGAPHVILVDHPTLDEVSRLQRSGFYDLIDAKDVREIRPLNRNDDQDDVEKQRDAFQGESDEKHTNRDDVQKTLTRLLCFDTYDDGSGRTTDMMFWVLRERGLLLKAKSLTEMYPVFEGEKPWRPVVSTSYLPVKGSVSGISLPELIEGLHDVRKQLFDQTIDFGTMTSFPWAFYRPSSSLKPETIRPRPMDLIPISDPDSVRFPQFSQNSQTFGFNMMAKVDEMSERLTLLNDIRAGRVPRGKSSALRTAGGLELLLSQSESRPERILRRFFIAWTGMFSMMHRLNRANLRKDRLFRIAGVVQPGEDPYQKAEVQSIRSAGFRFKFDANVLNASKQAVQAGIEQFAGFVVNPLMLQLGILNPDGIYKLAFDMGNALGMQPRQYIKPPTGKAGQPKVTAEGAISQILQNRAPQGVPLEESQEHVQKLLQLRDEYAKTVETLSPLQDALFRVWAQSAIGLAREEAQQAQLQQAAAEFQKQQGGEAQGDGRSNGAAPPDQEPTPLGEGELSDESLPGARGEF